MGRPMSTIRRDHRYTITPEHLILDPRVQALDFRLWCRLDRFAGDREVAFPSRETLAIELDASPSTIDRAVKRLVAAGWLDVERVPGSSSRYTLVTAPTREVERLIKAARKERIEASEGRRLAAQERDRDKKRKQRSGSNVHRLPSAQVSTPSLSTSDEGVDISSLSTSEEGALVTSGEGSLITSDEDKEATPEGSNTEGHPSPSLRSGMSATEEQLSLIEADASPAPKVPTFEDFYRVYPRHVGKAAAEKAWDVIAKKRTVDLAAVVSGAHRYANDPNLPEAQFIPYPASWLNAGRWDDDPEPIRVSENRGPQRGPNTTATDAMWAQAARPRRQA